MKRRKMKSLNQQVTEQRKWIEEHGRDAAGYVARYGDPSVGGDYYGMGGIAIYKADHDALVELESRR